MKVLEIKNNLVKIAYGTTDNLALSSFVVIQDTNSPYVAQVMNLKADVTANYAIVKLLFTFNEEGILKNYNGTIPSLKSTVTELPANELLDIIPIKNELKIGVLAEENTVLKVDKSILDNNLLVCSSNTENSSRLISNIASQLKETVIVIDTEGTLDFKNKISLGNDFKLPLNYDTINFIYDNDLEDVDATSKAIIQDIFIELQEYTKTLPERYLPFDTFLTVVNQQYKETQIPQLVLLKNKLLKYKELNVFAQNLKDILSLSMAIENSEFITIDLSNLPDILQKEVISYIYDVMKTIKDKIYSFVKIDNSNSDKKLLKTFLQNDSVSTIVLCPHEYKYVNLLKENAQNFILFAPLTLQHDFASYNTYLNKLNPDEFIIYGAHTQNIPLIVILEDSYQGDTPPEPEKSSKENIEQTPSQGDETDNTSNEEETIILEEKEPTIEEEPIVIEDEPIINETPEINEEPVIEDQQTSQNEVEEFPNTIEYPDITDSVEIVENNPEPEIEEDNQIIPNILEDPEPQEDTIIDETVMQNSEDTQIDDIKVEPLYDEASIDELAEVQDITLEDDQTDFQPEELQIEETPQLEQEISDTRDNDEIVQQVAKDIDKAMYEKIDTDSEISFNNEEEEIDELTEDDLNLIGDLNSDNSNENELEITDLSGDNPPVLPIYPSEDFEDEENQKLEPGDHVSTPKYGEGVVEKMIKYGNKMLCSIEFPNIGRRLLDPAMSEIKKLS